MRIPSFDGVELAGSLCLPAGADAAVPTVVVTHGAGIGTRDNYLFDHLVDLLSRHGFGCLIWDRRGEGASSGEPNRPYTVLAKDALAWISTLSTRPEVDPERLAVYGMSQGGWIGPLAAAAHPPIRALALVSACGMTPADQMVYLTETMLTMAGYGSDDIQAALALRRLYDEYARGRVEREEIEVAIATGREAPWWELSFISDETEPDAAARWGANLDLDIRPVIARVEVPTLLLYGATDNYVPIEPSIEIWRQAMPDGVPLDIARVPEVGHAMTIAEDRFDPLERGPISEVYGALLADWLRRRLAP